MRDLGAIIKAYDVRGVYPDQLDEGLARDVGAAFVRVCQITDGVVIGHDMRPSGPGLVAAFAEGVRAQGCSVVLIGEASTDELYYASGALNLPGAMFTASHNPAAYNGIKLCRAGAAPVGQDSGLREIRAMIEAGIPASHQPLGGTTHRNMLDEYAGFLRGLVDLTGIRPLRVAIDAGNGMAGLTVPAVLGARGLPLDITPMYFDLDGTFPNHEANPIDPVNLRDLQACVLDVGADLGLAFDGDADRCFIVDERGGIVSPSALTALIASRELTRCPGATIIHNLITSKSVPEVIAERGGRAVRTRVGHSFIKATMADTDAVFGGEHSGHFYFRDFWRADSGLLAAMHVLAALGSTAPGVTLSSLMAPYDRYVASGEINTEVVDQVQTTGRIRAAFASRAHRVDELDGLTVEGADWWFNVRPSNTEPLLRLNAEARDAATMAAVRDEVLAIMGDAS